MAIPVAPRPLTVRERAVLERILGSGVPGAAELRGQLDHVRVVAVWGVGSPSVDLEVAGDVARARVPSGVLPGTWTVVDDSGEPVGEILLWIDSGRLAGVEYAWYSDEPPASLPPADRIVSLFQPDVAAGHGTASRQMRGRHPVL